MSIKILQKRNQLAEDYWPFLALGKSLSPEKLGHFR